MAGQIANDPCMDGDSLATLLAVDPNDVSDEYLDEIKVTTKKYLNRLLVDKDSINADFRDGPTNDVGFIVAHKNISRDEEIYNSYGLSYWLRIPTTLCLLKGNPNAEIKLRRGASIAIEELTRSPEFIAHRGHMKNLQALYQGYLTEELANTFDIYHSSNSATKLMALVGAPYGIHLQILNVPIFQEMWDNLDIDAALSNIAEIPNGEFMDSTYWSLAHQESKALLQKVLSYAKAFSRPEFFQLMYVADGQDASQALRELIK